MLFRSPLHSVRMRQRRAHDQKHVVGQIPQPDGAQIATMVFLCDLRTIRLRYLADNELLVMLAALAHSHRMKRMVDLPWSMREDLRLPAISLLTGHGPA